jgi:hypothetical protein
VEMMRVGRARAGVVVSTNAIPVAYRLSHGGVDRRGKEDKVSDLDLLECSMFY